MLEFSWVAQLGPASLQAAYASCMDEALTHHSHATCCVSRPIYSVQWLQRADCHIQQYS